MVRLVALIVSVVFVAVACAAPDAVEARAGTDPSVSGNTGTGELSAPEPAGSDEVELVAGVNVAIADVPLDEVVFDTFDGGSVTLAEASEATVERLYNAIRPLDDPPYVRGDAVDWLDDGDIVLGYVGDDGSAWAHPHRILNFHEIVNLEVADRPVVITYCPLCGSGVVFDRRVDDLRHDGVLTFDNTSALYENDMVMVDTETNTYWWQVAGRGIVGNLTGAELTSLPSVTTTWGEWLRNHPDTRVLSNDQGQGPGYEHDPFGSYPTRVDAGTVPFPIRPEAFADERLAPSTRVIGFELADRWFAVPVLSNEPIDIAIEEADGVVVRLDGAGGGAVVDAAGDPYPSRSSFWFAWVSFTGGDTRVFGPDGEID